MKKLIDLYKKYFDLTTERFNIENDKKNWPLGWKYEHFVARVNEIYFEVQKLRSEILRLESLLENSY
jgi:hypothetical protein